MTLISPPRIAVVHLGCEKNRIDTEHMLGILATTGYDISASEATADYVIVNTCSFIEAARRESVQTLVALAEAGKKLVVTGCMAQHFQAELLEALPEAVALVGTGDYHQIAKVIERVEQGERVFAVSQDLAYIADETVPRYRKENMEVAVIKWNGTVLDIELPNTVVLEVIETDPGVKGDTATGGSKLAKLETGAEISVPLFIKVGEKVRVDTRTNTYLGREN